MFAQIVLIVPVISNNVQMIETIIWKTPRTIAKDQPDNRDNPICFGRDEFYPDNQGDHVNFEVIIWKRSQTTETIGTIIIIKLIIYFMTSNVCNTWRYAHTCIMIKSYPKNPHFNSRDQE